MVIKISTGKDFAGALIYNGEKVDRKEGTVLGTNIIREPADGRFNVYAVLDDFRRWMPSQFRTERPVLHISINPHPDDRISDEDLSGLATKYMKRMGYGGQPYIVFKHTDISRQHIHIVSTQVGFDGRKINDSNRNRRSTAIMEELEKEYGLIRDKGQKQEKFWQLSPVNPDKGHLKKQIASVIKSAVNNYRFQTMGEFRALLSLYNVSVEEVRGARSGKPYRGLLYGVIDTNNEKSTKPIKSSLFGKAFGFDALEKHMEESKAKIINGKINENTRRRVAEALKKTTSEKQLRENLKKQQIDLYLRRNDMGRITGVTFIDHTERCVLNGSRLGKEFSANQFENLFNIVHSIEKPKPRNVKNVKRR